MARCECLNYPASPLIEKYGLGVPAWRLQQRGYAVLPLARGAKKPHRMLPWDGAGKDGVHHASLHDAQIREWWGQDPAANIGVATGAVSRLVVIDLDVKRGVNGGLSFNDFLMENRLAMPAGVPWVRTPSGGYHIWLRVPSGVAVPERPGILPGVDVKGDGGFVVAPPSMILTGSIERPGEPRGAVEVPIPYSWIAGCPCSVPAAPPWLLPWLGTYKQDSTGRAVCPVDGTSLAFVGDRHGHTEQELYEAVIRDTRTASGSQAGAGDGESGESPDLASLKRTGIPRGQRNEQMYRLACSLFRKHGTSAESSVMVREELNEVWKAGDRNGFSAHELLTVIDSARRFVQGRVEEDQKIVAMGQEWLGRGQRQ